MIKLLIGAVLALTTSNAIADNIFIYEDSNQQDLTTFSKVAGNMYIKKSTEGQALLTNVNPSSNFNGFTKKVKVTYYRDSQSSNQKQAVSKEQKVSYGSNSDSASFADSAYLALR